jgi:hypothetical protein
MTALTAALQDRLDIFVEAYLTISRGLCGSLRCGGQRGNQD